ncbi:hypothetical protein GCM10010145_44880 [Streptomyces ruber]|uniref:Uncharacterized protein n=2 Tax=Streptomyces TaxID=1883 RepID=A0A918BHY4_9ACTN|nr:hypothetical protein [Streptomyces ruber]GGQ70347.1 hypothetical protein GCM10010145_44880 [Streptomyces ruber]
MPRDLPGDGDRTAVPERLRAAFDERVARYREPLVTVRGTCPPPAHREEFAWVVAALRARADG